MYSLFIYLFIHLQNVFQDKKGEYQRFCLHFSAR